MYPHELFFGIGFYELFLILGVVLAMVVFRVLGDKASLPAIVQNTGLFGIIVAIFVGYPSAVLVQSVYNSIASGEFSLSLSTGSTFYGGLIGGTIAYLIFYFTVGHFRCKNKEHLRAFPKVLDIAPCCVALAHASGRIGCFMAGCCFGLPTDSALGVYFKTVPYKVLPVQLFEAGFLFILFLFLCLQFTGGKRHNASVYLVGYGVWRFVAEYMRGDDRGETIVDFLTPSQLTAVVLIAFGIALFFLSKRIYALEEIPAGTAPAPTETAVSENDASASAENAPAQESSTENAPAENGAPDESRDA